MSRNVLVAVLVSILAHVGVAAGGALFHKKQAAVARASSEEVPTIELTLPPAPEPEPIDVLPDRLHEGPTDIADLAPPSQADVPTAVIDSPFVQKLQPTVATNLDRAAGLTIPANLRPGVSGGAGLGKIFDLSALDQRPQPRGPISPSYPPQLKRSGLKGEVLVEFIVDAQGNVRDPFVVRSSHSGFEDAALTAVQRARFQPGRKGGAAVNTRVQLPISFNLET